MRVIVAGGRDFTRARDERGELLEEGTHQGHVTLMRDALVRLLHGRAWTGFEGIEVVCGGARGADRSGELWAEARDVPIKYFHAEWDRLGRGAGPHRNTQMAAYADMLVAFWDGESQGTAHMINAALTRGLEVHVYRYSA